MFLRGYVSAIDEEYYQHYHGINARGQSVAIEHVPALITQSARVESEALESRQDLLEIPGTPMSSKKTLLQEIA